MSTRDDLIRFLRKPGEFARSQSATSREQWLKGLTEFAVPQIELRGEWPLRDAQVKAWHGIADSRVSLVLGPPGTGKTFALSWMALGYLHARMAEGLPCRILVTGFTLNSIGNLLDEIHNRASKHFAPPPPVLFLGSEPESGLEDGISIAPTSSKALKDVWRQLATEHLVIGCSVWSLFKLISKGDSSNVQGPTAPLFDLVCIDEASQMVVSHGLLALSGLNEDGRILVAGDNKQLAPIRQTIDHEIAGLNLGGSLYDFLKSANVPEFPLEETFRLNAPLTVFPEQQFYPGIYRSADEVSQSRLKLRSGWADGLADWERAVLDPEFPLCILLHDGPIAATQSPFEVSLVSRLVRRLWEAAVPEDGKSALTAETFWQKRLAVVTPHRAQNAAIRQALNSQPYGSECVVETVDRVQGKERDAIIASYTVADPEFAVAEGSFIYGSERLNVTATRAKTKLVFIISRQLLDATPSDPEVFEAAQILREFVFATEEAGTIEIPDAEGRSWSVAVRVRRFNSDAPLPVLKSETSTPTESLPELTATLKDIFSAIQRISSRSQYGSATVTDIRKELRREPAFSELRDLVRLGMVTMSQMQGRYGQFWVLKSLDPPRVPFSADPESVSKRIEEVIEGARRGTLNPFYYAVRDRFVWMDGEQRDVLEPVLNQLVEAGRLKWGEANGSRTIDLVLPPAENNLGPLPAPTESLTVADFELLNALEDIEARRINFGIFESWVGTRELARECSLRLEATADSLRRLKLHGFVMDAGEGRNRSRMAELAREVRYVKQRFRKGDAKSRPYLVRALKLENKNRERPERNISLRNTIDRLKTSFASTPHVPDLLTRMGEALRKEWARDDPGIAGFQERALGKLLASWVGAEPEDAFVITADTGSGKTEAAVLPLLVGAAYDQLRGITGTRAVLVYPRIRLSANQAQRLVAYLSSFAQTGFPLLTLGIQNAQVPTRFWNNSYLDEDLWERADGGLAFTFPFFSCPKCENELLIYPQMGMDGADRLSCFSCQWHFDGWIGSKEGLRDTPPSIFLIITESLHQWMHDPHYGVLFGDAPPYGPPRAILADEIHLYSHVHGAQVGYALRRVLTRAALNDQTGEPRLAIGMSATLGDAVGTWSELCGRTRVVELAPKETETKPNPLGREYFYFVQPEVESRGHDIAGAATTIQTLMCLAHGMRRRTGHEGGYRSIAFFDSIDKLKRLHSDYQDAEQRKVLSKFRTYLFDDDPGSTEPRKRCCGDPTSCDRFRDGECWYFAANDAAQWTAKGRYQPLRGLTVSNQPIFSGTPGRVERTVRSSDLVFATSTLEVGYDDPDMVLVYQHYAPLNLASFVQRKGRGGRGQNDRPITAVTLSVYSPRDSWYFRRPRDMFESIDFKIPLNLENVFAVRGQVLAAVLDAMARLKTQQPDLRLVQPGSGSLQLTTEAIAAAEQYVSAVFGEEVYERLEVSGVAELWKLAGEHTTQRVDPEGSLRDWREQIPWIPVTLFETINLPMLRIQYEDDAGKSQSQREDIVLALNSCAPGNMTRRYAFRNLHWIPPTDGKAPFLSIPAYKEAGSFAFSEIVAGGVTGFLEELPTAIREELGTDIHPLVCQPSVIELQKAGRMDGASWVSFWRYDKKGHTVVPFAGQEQEGLLKLGNKCRGALRGFLLVQASKADVKTYPVPGGVCYAAKLDVFTSNATKGKRTGLQATRIYWGADTDLRLEEPGEEVAGMTQVFIHPKTSSTLLHGYRIETEGVRLHLDSERLSAFVEDEIAKLDRSEDGKWLRGRLFRYAVESRCISKGLNSYEAQRISELLVTAAGFEELRLDLAALLRRWDSVLFANLMRRTYQDALLQHPLLTNRRVNKLLESFDNRAFQVILKEAMAEASSPRRFRDYIRSLVLHGIAIRLKQLFVIYGHGDEQRVLFHVKLPIQFRDMSDVISVFENGEHGDGTTRSFVLALERAFATWKEGALGECPNALEDALYERVFEYARSHREWREWDPHNEDYMIKLGDSLGLTPQERRTSLSGITRLLYGYEAVQHERFEFFALHQEIRSVREKLRSRMTRQPSAWELVSAAVRQASLNDRDLPKLAKLLNFYRNLEDASIVESLSPESRLADQVYRFSASLCVDGCPACLHTGSDMMPDSLAETTVSRRVLDDLSKTL